MNRHMFPEDVVVADAQPGRLAIVLKILRRLAKDDPGVNGVRRTNRCCPRDMNVRSNPAVRADHHPFIDDRIGTNDDTAVNFRFGMNDGGLMNHE
jgi:hypothetical protein